MDFLAIGDIVTDTFIHLKEAHVITDANGEHPELAMSWGNKLPYEDAVVISAVGNSPNAAVSAARLGLSSSLRTYIGDDMHGKECLAALEKEHVATEYVVAESSKKTNHHYVLSFESERTILVKHEAFSYTVPALSESPKWIYLSSLGSTSLPYHKALVAFFQQHPTTQLAFQPGTFQMELGVTALKEIYERTDLFFCNKEEAECILELDAGQDIVVLLKKIHALGPKKVVITDGREGAYAYDGNEALFVPMYPDNRPPVERTGAGDAFASTVTAALALGEPFKQALLWGPINSMSVVQEIGAQKGLLTKDALLSYLEKAPAEYTTTVL